MSEVSESVLNTANRSSSVSRERKDIRLAEGILKTEGPFICLYWFPPSSPVQWKTDSHNTANLLNPQPTPRLLRKVSFQSGSQWGGGLLQRSKAGKKSLLMQGHGGSYCLTSNLLQHAWNCRRLRSAQRLHHELTLCSTEGCWVTSLHSWIVWLEAESSQTPLVVFQKHVDVCCPGTHFHFTWPLQRKCSITKHLFTSVHSLGYLWSWYLSYQRSVDSIWTSIINLIQFHKGMKDRRESVLQLYFKELCVISLQ